MAQELVITTPIVVTHPSPLQDEDVLQFFNISTIEDKLDQRLSSCHLDSKSSQTSRSSCPRSSLSAGFSYSDSNNLVFSFGILREGCLQATVD
jgi:hypothetical protein